jgi:hypothetical protein
MNWSKITSENTQLIDLIYAQVNRGSRRAGNDVFVAQTRCWLAVIGRR